MIHTSRLARPTLRRAASATPSLNANTAEFSKQFGFQHLLNSPLPSPALPSIVPRHGKKPTTQLFRRAFRISARLSSWLVALILLYWLARQMQSATGPPYSVTFLSVNVHEYNVAGQGLSPQDAVPILVADAHKNPKWTVSIPRDAEFPLKPSQYADICARSVQIVKQLSPGHTHFHAGSRESQSATGFVDVQEAHDQGLLSMSTIGPVQPDTGAVDDGSKASVESNLKEQTHDKNRDPIVCDKSLTFLMESADAGMGKTLLGLWIAYGLAQEEGRSFFIDDSNWAYGRYATFFSPAPVPTCLPPPAIQRLSCPRQTRHLVVSSSTYQWIFAGLIEPLPPKRDSHMPAARKHRAFSLARIGHDALFYLTGDDASYLSTRLSELDSRTHSQGGCTIGLHVRRGDRRPWEPQYSDSYIPPSSYLSAAQSLLNQHFNPRNITLTHEAATGISASTLLLASDDPDIYTAPEFSSSMSKIDRAQSQIFLASKAALDAALPDPAPVPTSDPAFIKFVEPNVGWEGGFFASIFWGLGNAAEGRRAARGERPERPQETPSEETRRLREYVGRAYLMELKVLAYANGGVVCGVSSFGCRLLGVMRGWTDVEKGERWKNVDAGYGGWVGLVEGD
ncbi:MAG: hypothetical protein Q9207_002252 [Kuettlingeria erythrocarpa]